LAEKHGERQKELYMSIPEGMDIDSSHCLKLKKSIFQANQHLDLTF
jgi:hypothetical protein